MPSLRWTRTGGFSPPPTAFPRQNKTHSFKPIADLLHAKGLKFGVHLLRGIPRQAVENNVPILGAETHAADIADKQSICRWNTDMYGVDMTKKGAQEYYDSVFALLASWEVDLVKVDDLLSYPYHAAEIEAIRRAIDKTGRPIILSGSPSIPSIESAAHISTHANMWRISDDFWDNWARSLRAIRFKASIGRLTAVQAGHFPDADMLSAGECSQWAWRLRKITGRISRMMSRSR